MTLDLRRYGFSPEDASKMYTVTQIPAYKGQDIELDPSFYYGDKVRLYRSLKPRDVVLLEIKQAKS